MSQEFKSLKSQGGNVGNDQFFSYKCISCLSLNSTTCNETETDCIGNQCMTASQYYYNGGDWFQSIFKGCANDSMCEEKGFLSQENVKVRGYIHCCTGDLCNTQGYKLPKEDKKTNGKKCPSCYSRGTQKECKTDEEVECTGSETRCFDYRGEIMHPGCIDAVLKEFYCIQNIMMPIVFVSTDQKVGNYSIKGCCNSFTCICNFDSAIGIKELHRKHKSC
ncbi:phospholipase A2 inhibitor CNF-like [Rhinoderma darwinii]|uniref:phospholipase A2 inhibitor CNF-like n=1 Tax=Rhinoderma darwinii TaxID=43563 RepID=UPI003F680869